MLRIDGTTGKIYDDRSPEARFKRGMPMGLSEHNNYLSNLAYRMVQIQLRGGGKLGRKLTDAELAETLH